MNEKLLKIIKNWLTIFDLPSGVIMGVVTMTMLGMMVAAFVLKRPLDGSILTCYGMIVVPFAAHKTITAVTSSSSQVTDTTTTGGPQ